MNVYSCILLGLILAQGAAFGILFRRQGRKLEAFRKVTDGFDRQLAETGLDMEELNKKLSALGKRVCALEKDRDVIHESLEGLGKDNADIHAAMGKLALDYEEAVQSAGKITDVIAGVSNILAYDPMEELKRSRRGGSA